MPVVRGVFLPKAPFPAELIGGFCGTRAAPSPDRPRLKPKPVGSNEWIWPYRKDHRKWI